MRRQVRIGSAKRERARRCEVNHAAGDCCVRAKRANFINDFNLYPLAQPVLTRSTFTRPVLTLALFLSHQPPLAAHSPSPPSSLTPP